MGGNTEPNEKRTQRTQVHYFFSKFLTHKVTQYLALKSHIDIFIKVRKNV